MKQYGLFKIKAIAIPTKSGDIVLSKFDKNVATGSIFTTMTAKNAVAAIKYMIFLNVFLSIFHPLHSF